MAVDEKLVRRVATLARIAVAEEDVPRLAIELSAILGFVEQLAEVDTQGVAPLTSATGDTALRTREDVITDGGYPQEVLANAPVRDDEYFAVPKVIE